MIQGSKVFRHVFRTINKRIRECLTCNAVRCTGFGADIFLLLVVSNLCFRQSMPQRSFSNGFYSLFGIEIVDKVNFG